MNYETVRVVRDGEKKNSYFTLHDGRHLCVSDSGEVSEVSSLPETDPEGTMNPRFFEIKAWPASALKRPSRPAERVIELLTSEANRSYRIGERRGTVLGLLRGKKKGISIGKKLSAAIQPSVSVKPLRLAHSTK